jgi:adenine/guanine phosphoribosyltransferase-like PRPP-binding protein
MAPDEVMVYSSMALVPAVAGLVGLLTLLAVRRQAMSALASCVLFIAAVPAGMLLSVAVVKAFSHLLHGDGALAIIAAPVTGAILTAPVALIFAVALAVIRSQRHA